MNFRRDLLSQQSREDGVGLVYQAIEDRMFVLEHCIESHRNLASLGANRRGKAVKKGFGALVADANELAISRDWAGNQHLPCSKGNDLFENTDREKQGFS